MKDPGGCGPIIPPEGSLEKQLAEVQSKLDERTRKYGILSEQKSALALKNSILTRDNQGLRRLLDGNPAGGGPAVISMTVEDFNRFSDAKANLEKRVEALKQENDLLKSDPNVDFRLRCKALMNVINRLKELLERVPVRLNSRNSGISPSKNLFPPPRSESDPDDGDGAPKRKPGGQVGHERNIRGVFTEQMAKRIVDWTTLNSQPCCGVELERYPERDILREKYEKPPDPVERNMREIFAYRCPKCGKIHHAYTPPEIMDKSLLDDALLVDLLVYKSMNTLSVRKLQAIYSDLLDVNNSTGGLVDLSKAVGRMLRPKYLEALHSVKHHPLLYIDETSFRIMK